MCRLIVLCAATAAATAATLTPVGGARLDVSRDVSANWAGYTVTGSPARRFTFTRVTASWTVPRVRCSARDGRSAVAIWVGIGGYASSTGTLQQVGTDAACSSSGIATYHAWYELLPKPSARLRLAVHPGDVVTASVTLAHPMTAVRLALANETTGRADVKELRVAQPDTLSAEWIVEAPSACATYACAAAPLADFGTVTFTRAGATGNGRTATISGGPWTAVAIELVPAAEGGHPGHGAGGAPAEPASAAASPRALVRGGRGFSVDWVANSSLVAGPRS